uniref:Uncharacterized protein n=1 Tax=Anopheles farauti TaxID=69004 RepID=A0A182Q9X3_9DIPT
MGVEPSARNISREFFHLKAWYIYAYTDPPPNYLSMFNLPPGASAAPTCLRLFTENWRGLLILRYNCPNYAEIQRFTLYSDNDRGEGYQQVHNYKVLYKVFRRFGQVQALTTDGDTYVVFYGCQQVRHRALVGLMVLVREDVYDRFTPPPELVQLLWWKLSFNVSQHLVHNLSDGKEGCDCAGAVRYINQMILKGYTKQKAQLQALQRIREQFPIGIRNFFVCAFSFALVLLCVNKLIDKYVFDLKY